MTPSDGTWDQWDEYVRHWERSFQDDPQGTLREFRYFHQYKHTYGYMRMLNRGLDVMASKGQSSKSVQQNSAFTTFVNVNIPAHMKEQVRTYLTDGGAWVAAVSDLLENGYRLGVSYDEKRDALIASLTCRKSGDANEGKTLTAFAGTWPEAITVVLFKHWVVCEGKWTEPAERDTFG